MTGTEPPAGEPLPAGSDHGRGGSFDPAHGEFKRFAGPLLEGDGRGALVLDLVAGG